MAKFDDKMRKSILFRMILPCGFILLFVFAISKRAYDLTLGEEGEEWRKVLKKEHPNDSSLVQPLRGNIYSYDGVLLASSVEEHKLIMDFKADGFDDNLFMKNIDSLCICVARLYGNIHDAAYYKEKALKAKKSKSRYFMFENTYVSHSAYKRAKQFPFWRERANKTGFHAESRVERKKTFGNLGGRTIGGFRKDINKGNSGLEMFYDKDLKGEPGFAVREFHGKKWTWVPVDEPLNGADVYSTLDMRMQDVVSSALSEVMNATTADSGCAIVMDVHSGEVRAIANLTRTGMSLQETRNYAVNMQTEPGSVFKVASLIALLESGKVDTSYVIETGDGEWKGKNWTKPMKDWKSEGFGTISLARAVHVSSNIGISKPVYEHFNGNKDKFVEKLYAMKLNDPMKLDIPGTGRPNIRSPKDESVVFDDTYLPWMSIGYSVQVPPIYTLTFYNAIANNGKMIKPIFAKSIRRNGRVEKTFSTEVLCSQICSNNTLGKVRTILKDVINQGTGKTYGKSDILDLAGKSGTAQLHYQNGVPKDYQMSFVGYFPADEPKYTCMVVTWQQKSICSTNLTSKAFRTIAERVYAMTPVKCETAMCEDDHYAPKVKGGYKKDVMYLLDELKIRHAKVKMEDEEWVSVETRDSVVDVKKKNIAKHSVPNVIGMGAKDALYLLENLGLKVEMRGRGEVVQQSIAPGESAAQGKLITILLR